MCSLQSRRKVPTPPEHAETLRQAFVDVAQESFFSFAEPCEPARYAEAVETIPAPDTAAAPRWIAGHVAFDGAFAGAVTIALPYQLATDMMMALAGLMPGDDTSEQDVIDATGEFVNMVCGTWLTRACVHRRFDLHPPRVSDTAPATAPPDEGDQLLLINDQPVRMSVEFRAA